MRASLLSVLLVLSCGTAAADQIAEHRLTVAANPSMQVSDQEIDSILAGMNSTMAASDSPCPNVRFTRVGPVITSSNLLITGDFASLSRSMRTNAPAANVLVVTGINCAGIVAAGCGNVGQEPLVVGSYPGYDTILWLHERGHNVGLQHSAESPATDTSVPPEIGKQFMFWQLGLDHVRKTAAECSNFKNARLSSIVQVQAPAAGPAAAVAPAGAAVPADAPTPQQLGLTPLAFDVVVPPWVDKPPLDQINRLDDQDLASIRTMLRGSASAFFRQAVQVIGLRGNGDDVDLLTSVLNQPMPAVTPDAPPANKIALRNLLAVKLATPQAIGWLANRSGSEKAVDTLTKIADVTNASELVGVDAAPALSKASISGLAVSKSPKAEDLLSKFVPEVASPAPSPAKINNPPPLSPSEIERIQKNIANTKKSNLDTLLKNGELQ